MTNNVRRTAFTDSERLRLNCWLLVFFHAKVAFLPAFNRTLDIYTLLTYLLTY